MFNVKRKQNIIAVINDIYYNDILLTFHISRQYSIQNIPTNVLHHQDFWWCKQFILKHYFHQCSISFYIQSAYFILPLQRPFSTFLNVCIFHVKLLQLINKFNIHYAVQRQKIFVENELLIFLGHSRHPLSCAKVS